MLSPIKLTTIIFKKIITKKNHVGKHYSNPVFCKESYNTFPHDLALL